MKFTNYMKLIGMCILIICVGFVFSSCARVKITGGGKLVNGKGKESTFTLNANSCSKDNNGNQEVKGNITYIDKNCGTPQEAVKLKGEVIKAHACTFTEDGEFSLACIFCHFYGYDVAVKFAYTSINPFRPGEGYGIACATDNGQGVNDPPDDAAIGLFGGPFDGYVNWGTIQGNLDKKDCKAEEN